MDSKPSQRNDRRNVATENGLRKIFIQKSDGKKLVGILHETGSKEVVIICHGFRSSKDCAPVVNLAAALESQSISAFRFDFPGYGESEEPFQLDISLRNPDVLHDVVQHFVKNKRIVTAIVGHSQGGCDALRYASKYNHVRTVVNISGWINLAKVVEAMFGKAVFEEIRQKGFVDVKNKKGEVWIHATQEQWMEMQRVDIRSEVLLISEDCRVLTVHGSKDEVVSPADSFEYAKLIRNHKLHIIEGADHEYTSHQGELASAVLNFIKQGSWRQEGASILSRI
uniref:Serine aminopeptidase S33 domain-containing protein n=1 Tax=Kalanchoe fedtschenkoi TaxID=63787 RepID=A0A7N0U7U1_KALFE